MEEVRLRKISEQEKIAMAEHKKKHNANDCVGLNNKPTLAFGSVIPSLIIFALHNTV